MEKENSARAQGNNKNMTVEEYLKKVGRVFFVAEFKMLVLLMLFFAGMRATGAGARAQRGREDWRV